MFLNMNRFLGEEKLGKEEVEKLVERNPLSTFNPSTIQKSFKQLHQEEMDKQKEATGDNQTSKNFKDQMNAELEGLEEVNRQTVT